MDVCDLGALHGLWLVIEMKLREISARSAGLGDAQCGTYRRELGARAGCSRAGW